MDNRFRGKSPWRGAAGWGSNNFQGRGNFGGPARRPPFRGSCLFSYSGVVSPVSSFNRGGGSSSRHFGGPPRHGGGYKGNSRNFGNNRKKHGSTSSKQDFPKRDFDSSELSEHEIGISEFVSDHEGFSGIIKARFSDFHVNEIDTDGNITKLTTTKVPDDPEPEQIEEDDDDLVSRYRNEHLPVEIWDKIHALVQKKSGRNNERVEVDVTNKTKEDRTKIHEAVKMVFGQKIVGSTIVKDGGKFISFMKFDKNARIDKRQKWPKERGGEYVYFLVHKEHCDTLEAVLQIAECLRIKPSMLSYAGAKDRRAKTTQWFCVKRIDPAVLSTKCVTLKNIRLGNYCYKAMTLKLGQLKGNRFRVALRNVTASEEIITKALTSFKENGFLNYYGLQRFGNSSEIPTYAIGLELLKGNWKEACDLILKPRKAESDKRMVNARQIFKETMDPRRALNAMGRDRDRTVEGKLLQGMSRHHVNDYINALENIPRNMRILYIHAYQSLIWNKILTRRVKEFGLKPIPGDLVLVGNADLYLDSCYNDMSSTEKKSDTESESTVASEPTETVEVIEEKIERPKVKVLTEEDLKNYTIYDIVLPLPGFDIQYPENIVKDWYQELLRADSLDLEMAKQKVKTYCLSGAYRKCVGKAENLSWYNMHYNDPHTNLIQSDYEEMIGRPPPKDNPSGKFKALILDFCLSSSSYATMALRELLKCDTSRGAHAKLNKYFEKDVKKDDENTNQKNDESEKEKENSSNPVSDNPDDQNGNEIKKEELAMDEEPTVKVENDQTKRKCEQESSEDDVKKIKLENE